MKIKSSGRTMLYIIILAVIVYLLFMRQQSTSGFKSTPENISAYSSGVNDAKQGIRKRRNIKKRSIYNEGYDDMKEYLNISRKIGSSSGRKNSSQLSARSSKLFARIQRKLGGSSSSSYSSSTTSSGLSTLSSIVGITLG